VQIADVQPLQNGKAVSIGFDPADSYFFSADGRTITPPYEIGERAVPGYWKVISFRASAVQRSAHWFNGGPRCHPAVTALMKLMHYTGNSSWMSSIRVTSWIFRISHGKSSPIKRPAAASPQRFGWSAHD
jgi:hypothetical protein